MPALASANDIYRVRVSAAGIIKRALRLLGAADSGEDLKTNELADGVEALNHMIDSWNTETLTIPTLVRNSFTLTAAQQAHEIGPAAELDAPRPQMIEPGQAFVTGQTLGTVEYPLDVYTQLQWGEISDKTTVGMPSVLYYETKFPLGVVNLYPVNDLAYTLVLYSWQMLQQVFMDSVNGEFALQPGYTEALVKNLAVELAPEWGMTASAEVLMGAVRARGNIKRMNSKPLIMDSDIALQAGGRYDIATGEIW
jgi:hypothetical protein